MISESKNQKVESKIGIGSLAEEYAGHYLQACGYQVIANNWRQGRYELDLVACKENGELLFVEVKAGKLGTEPEMHFSAKKQQDFAYAIEAYLENKHLWENDFRGDFISITLATSGAISQLEHYVDAI